MSILSKLFDLPISILPNVHTFVGGNSEISFYWFLQLPKYESWIMIYSKLGCVSLCHLIYDGILSHSHRPKCEMNINYPAQLLGSNLQESGQYPIRCAKERCPIHVFSAMQLVPRLKQRVSLGRTCRIRLVPWLQGGHVGFELHLGFVKGTKLALESMSLKEPRWCQVVLWPWTPWEAALLRKLLRASEGPPESR